MGWVKARIAERTSWDGATIIGISVLVLMAAPIVKLLVKAFFFLWDLYSSKRREISVINNLK